MTEYYYVNNEEQVGPVDLETIEGLVQSKVIDGNTLIWHKGLVEWTAASKVAECHNFFVSPPPINKPQADVKTFAKELEEKQRTLRVKRNRLIRRLALVVVIIAAVFAARPIISHILERVSETTKPTNYITLTNVNHSVNLGLKSVFTGYINNSSSGTSYKDVEIRVDWYNRNGSLVTTKFHTINELVTPWSEVRFKIKHKSPLSAKTYSIDIIDATPAD